jgi:hypothetical protein
LYIAFRGSMAKTSPFLRVARKIKVLSVGAVPDTFLPSWIALM